MSHYIYDTLICIHIAESRNVYTENPFFYGTESALSRGYFGESIIITRFESIRLAIRMKSHGNRNSGGFIQSIIREGYTLTNHFNKNFESLFKSLHKCMYVTICSKDRNKQSLKVQTVMSPISLPIRHPKNN